LPAFTGRVVATEEAFFQLPEVGLGLVPGAGGTVSLPRRIGSQRTAWLGLSGARIDARKALAWGLVDEVRLRQHVD
jgi:enoyl-CoA hydratase